MWPFKTKQAAGNINLDVIQYNELYQALYKWIMTGFPLAINDDLQSLIVNGLQANSIVFGVISKLCIMGKDLPTKLVIETSQGENEVSPSDPCYQLFERPNKFQSIRSWKEELYQFYLTTGNAMWYGRPLEFGNNAGKIDTNGLNIMPSQFVEPISGGWKRPIDHYILKLDQEERMMAENVGHVKFPNINYQDGKNLMGLAPLKVAINKLNMLNASDKFMAKSLERGMPPFILSLLKHSSDPKKAKEELEASFKRKYLSKSGEKAGIPIIGPGELQLTKLGFDTFRDLMILEMSQDGARALCTVYGVSSRRFANDTQGTTYNNMKEDEADAYQARIIPDWADICEELTWKICKRYNENYKYKIIKSEISALQEDKDKLATRYQIGLSKNAVSRNEYRVDVLNKAPYPDAEFDDPNTNSPLLNSFTNMNEDDTNKFMDRNKIDLYAK